MASGYGAAAQPSDRLTPADAVEPLPAVSIEPGQRWLAKQAAEQPSDTLRRVASYLPGGGKGNWSCPVCDDCPHYGLQAFVGYDAFRGISDGGWQNNGIHTGINYGTRLGALSEWTGIGFQAGGSVNVYDWSGADYRPNMTSAALTQGFVTYGLFRKANLGSKVSGAFVQDWMFNNNYGEYSQSPTLSQWRMQLGYAVSARNEFGLWGTYRFLGDTKNVPGQGATTWRPINQLNAYWHYKWAPGGADTWLWAGVPENDRLGASGSLGSWIVGVLANVPLNDRIALYTLVTYMRPSASPGPAAAEEDFWNFSIGLTLYPQRNARSTSVAGQCWMPQLPVANNGYFLVDTSRH